MVVPVWARTTVSVTTVGLVQTVKLVRKRNQIEMVSYAVFNDYFSDFTDFCATSCQNGGTCTGPNRCTCPSGWTGSNCQTCKKEESNRNGF